MRKRINMNNQLVDILTDMGDDKLAKIVRSRQFCESYLKPNYPNNLGFDGKLVTYLGSNKTPANGNVWTDNTRQSSKMVKVINKMFNEKFFIQNNVTTADVESFVSKWDAKDEHNCIIKVSKGWDILRTFNFKGDIDLKKFGSSCANFKQPPNSSYNNPKIKWFYFYIYNPNISVVTVEEEGIIKARSVMFSGVQQEDSRDYKKGETYNFMNNIYAEGQAKYKTILINWASEQGYILSANGGIYNHATKKAQDGSLIIPMKTSYGTYPPVDSLYVDTEKNLLITKLYGTQSRSVKSAYKLRLRGQH
jgi:hypothetical protein